MIKKIILLILLIIRLTVIHAQELLPSVNMQLEDNQHPYTGIIYKRVLTQRIVDGEVIAIIVPQFEAIFEAILPNELLLASDNQHKKHMNKLLKNAIKHDKRLRKKFTKQQLAHINNNKVPIGYVWHHDAILGRMQLVDKVIHDATPHTGGRWIWGGGKSNRR